MIGLKMNHEHACQLSLKTREVDFGLFAGLAQHSRDLITSWSDRGIEMARDPFEGFIFLWLAVNGWGACIADSDNDKEWESAVANNDKLGDLFISLLNQGESFREVAERFRQLWPVFKSSDIRRRGITVFAQATRVERIKTYLSHGLKVYQPSCWTETHAEVPLDWLHTFNTLYRVRCNLFHGEKMVALENDFLIVNAAYSVLAEYVRHTRILTITP